MKKALKQSTLTFAKKRKIEIDTESVPDTRNVTSLTVVESTSNADSIDSCDLIKHIPKDWQIVLSKEFTKSYFKKLSLFVATQRASNTIYPSLENTFSFLQLPLQSIRVVILGQDPYHGENQAHGLCFSVQKGIAIPPSLRNVYKELDRSDAFTIPKHGYLGGWIGQGVFMMNATMTVAKGQANSHAKSGWQIFSDAIIQKINSECMNVVFMLWGAFAQKKGASIDRTKHLVLESVHPSPLSAHRGFIGCDHFVKANEYLEASKRGNVDWNVINKE